MSRPFMNNPQINVKPFFKPATLQAPDAMAAVHQDHGYSNPNVTRPAIGKHHLVSSNLYVPPLKKASLEHSELIPTNNTVANGMGGDDWSDSPENDLYLGEGICSSQTNSNDGLFVTPNRRKNKSHPARSPQDNRNKSENTMLNLKNRYAGLPEVPDSHMDHSNIVNEDYPQKKPKIPPIFLKNAKNYQEITKDINNVVKSEFMTEVRGSTLKIITSTIDDFRALTKFYDTSKVEFHTFKPNQDKHLEVVIKNVPISLTVEEIKLELISTLPVMSVTRLLNKDKLPMPVCVVELVKSDQGFKVFELERLLYSIVKVEPKRKSNQIPQCTRCQRFGHTKNFCRLAPRCVRCTGLHHFSVCPVNKNDPPKCINCGEGHTANYRGCAHYQTLKSKSTNNLKSVTRPQRDGPSIPGNCDTQLTSKPSTNSSSRPNNTNFKPSYSQVLGHKNVSSEEIPAKPSCSTDFPIENNLQSSFNTGVIETIILDIFKQIMPQIKSIIFNAISSFFTHGDK